MTDMCNNSNWPVTDQNGRQQKTQAVVFGLGSMFNHSRKQNVGWTKDIAGLNVSYKALRDIQAGEELCESAQRN